MDVVLHPWLEQTVLVTYYFGGGEHVFRNKTRLLTDRRLGKLMISEKGGGMEILCYPLLPIAAFTFFVTGNLTNIQTKMKSL